MVEPVDGLRSDRIGERSPRAMEQLGVLDVSGIDEKGRCLHDGIVRRADPLVRMDGRPRKRRLALPFGVQRH